MEGIFKHKYETFPFEIFSFSHILMIIVMFIGVLFIILGRSFLKKHNQIVRISFFTILFLLEFLYHIWLYSGGVWDVSFALPLQLCSISLILCLIMLLTKSQVVFQIVYFMGISGALMAIITPELFLGYPHFRFFQFFITHILIIWTCIYYVIVHQYIPTTKGLVSSFFFLNGCAAIAYFFNKITRGNYMFLSYKPINGSLLDYFGPYPYYILSLEAAALILFILLLLPYKLKKKRYL